MAQERTAQQLVDMVRDVMLEKSGNVQFRDGFTSDSSPDAAAISILAAINRAMRKLAFTGYAQSTEIKVLTPASGVTSNHQYTLGAEVIRVTSATLLSVDGNTVYDLEEIIDEAVDRIKPRIRFGSSGRPREWYNKLNLVGVAPKPDAAYSLACETHIVPPDLPAATPTETPDYLPSYFHEALAWGAAIMLAATQVENDAAQRRIPVFQNFYNSFVDELASACGTSPEPARIRMVSGIEPGRYMKENM